MWRTYVGEPRRGPVPLQAADHAALWRLADGHVGANRGFVQFAFLLVIASGAKQSSGSTMNCFGFASQ
jgi:hypothetical protein